MGLRTLQRTRIGMFLGLLLLLQLPGSASAQWLQQLFRRQSCCPSPPPVCPAPAPSQPPAKPETPTPPPKEPVPELPETAAGVQGGLGLAYSAAEQAPNMFGEFFGGSALRITLQLPPIPGVNQNITVSHFNNDAFMTQPAFTNQGNTFVNFGTVLAKGTGGFRTVLGPGVVFNANGPVVVPTTPVNANPQETQALTQIATGKFGSGALSYLGGNFTFVPSTSAPNGSQGDIVTMYNYFRAAVPQTVFLEVPSPAGGGAVGRTKVSEDNNPLPRDRVIFEYDYFDAVPLTNAGVGVHRFSPGFEKTFFDRLTSIEVRFPFASTLDSNLNSGMTDNPRAMELGDIHITLKGLIYRSPELNVAVGLGIDLPTASDTKVFFTDGTEVVRIKNEDVLLTPYLAYLWTPNDRLFFQNWFEFCFDPNGNPVEVNPDFTTLRSVGRITDQSIMEIDAQIGYWLYRSEGSSRGLTALAPFFELHYNTTLNKADTVNAGAFSIGATSGHFDQLNISTGFIAQIGENFTLSVGAAFPLKNGTDRSFDYQLGIRANWFFGPTARERSRATPVQGF